MDDPMLRFFTMGVQHRQGRGLRSRIERCESGAALGGQMQQPHPAIVRRGTLAHQALALEPRQHAAEIALIQSRHAFERRRRHRLGVGDFINHPCFGQRKRGIEQVFSQDADLPRVKTAEPADFTGAQIGFGHS